ncbi:MAG: PfkB family carbohydrate kinase [Candidatus Adiutrix sp.]|jgi:rfaE bifunctional protein nucleotidyltransferase chain/domain|nr:PfkB family carbohydrate kinase [Candidatus Adiutrix sp.]
MNKILDFDKLVELVDRQRSEGRRAVLCHGVFDLLHIGHIRYLRRAREFGDFLVVTLTPDRWVDKGPGRPVFTEALRAEALASLGVVDYVAINQWPTAENTLRRLRPAFYAKGAEFKGLEDPTGKIALEAAAAAEAGSELVFVEDIVYSSSTLINRHLDVYPEELAQYLELLRQRYRLEDVMTVIDRMRDLKVLIVGDAIIDQYAYCQPLGLSSKDPTMTLRQISRESFPGGAVAVARHASGLSGQVALFTSFGEKCPWRQLAEECLPPHVELLAEEVPDMPTVRKLRYLDSYSLAKLLEIYHLDDSPSPPETIRARVDRLAAVAPDYDLVLAADFGHGFITPEMIEVLTQKSAFLAVNTQANAGNRGYHTILRYPKADFISLARHEISLAFQNRQAPVLELMSNLFQKIDTKTILVTCGADGLKALTANDYVQTPALAAKVVDRVGAGDALFVATALAAYLKCPLELLGLIGNIAGARLVENVGNNTAINASGLKKALTAMLK